MVEKQSSDSVKNYPPTFEWQREFVFVRRRDELRGGGGTFIFLARMIAPEGARWDAGTSSSFSSLSLFLRFSGRPGSRAALRATMPPARRGV